MGTHEASPSAPESVASRMDTSTALQRLGRSRDPEAWRAILDAHGMAILNLARRITGDAALAEDVCQETLLQIRADAGRYRPLGKPAEVEFTARGWIMRIACHTASKMLRRREGARKREARVRDRGVAMVPSAGEVALSREEAELVRHEVSALSEPLREAVCLHFYAGLTYAELAASVACSVEAAKKRVQRGLERLRSRLVSRGLMISLAALTLQLGGGGTAQAAVATTAVTAVAAEAQRQVAWQALLNSAQQPVFSCVAEFGATALVSKVSMAASAAIIVCLTSLSAYYISSTQAQGQREQAAVLQRSVEDLQRQLSTAQREIETLRSDLVAREDENSVLQRQADDARTELESLTQSNSEGVKLAFRTDGMLQAVPHSTGVLRVFGKSEPSHRSEKGDTATPEERKELLLQNRVDAKVFRRVMVLHAANGRSKEVSNGGQVRRFEIDADEGQVVIRLDGLNEMKEPGPQEPPKVQDDF